MKILYLFFALYLFSFSGIWAQEITIDETGTLEQVYGEAVESENLLPFNDLNIEFGYVLYQTEIEVESEDAVLTLDNVRDYAVVYLDDKFQGNVTDSNKKLLLNAAPGKYRLRIYAENIGRITYGPEILDNAKGLFGNVSLDGVELENWTIIPLDIKECDVDKLEFKKQEIILPCFHRGQFDIETPKTCYLDISGWGMGEVWINKNYMGSYWEEEKQQSIQISAGNLLKGKNEIIVFEMKNNNQKTMKISDNLVFR